MIQFKNIKLKFDDKVIFEDFNLNIKEGEKILLSAPSGKGKSTLFKMLLGFQKPEAGEIFLKGSPLTKSTLMDFRSNISYVSQDVDLRNQKVRELLTEIFQYKPNKHIGFNEDKFRQSVELFDLPKDILDKEVNQLSGGERQRLGLVICALLDRQVWLLDEVTSGLDKEMKEKVLDYVLGQDKTVVIISHDRIWRDNDKVRIEEW